MRKAQIVREAAPIVATPHRVLPVLETGDTPEDWRKLWTDYLAEVAEKARRAVL